MAFDTLIMRREMYDVYDSLLMDNGLLRVVDAGADCFVLDESLTTGNREWVVAWVSHETGPFERSHVNDASFGDWLRRALEKATSRRDESPVEAVFARGLTVNDQIEVTQTPPAVEQANHDAADIVPARLVDAGEANGRRRDESKSDVLRRLSAVVNVVAYAIRGSYIFATSLITSSEPEMRSVKDDRQVVEAVALARLESEFSDRCERTISKVVIADSYAVASWKRADHDTGASLLKKNDTGWLIVGMGTGSMTARDLAAFRVPARTRLALAEPPVNVPEDQSLHGFRPEPMMMAFSSSSGGRTSGSHPPTLQVLRPLQTVPIDSQTIRAWTDTIGDVKRVHVATRLTSRTATAWQLHPMDFRVTTELRNAAGVSVKVYNLASTNRAPRLRGRILFWSSAWPSVAPADDLGFLGFVTVPAKGAGSARVVVSCAVGDLPIDEHQPFRVVVR